jgi:hypothetical protein
VIEFIGLAETKQLTVLPLVNNQLHPVLKSAKTMGEGEIKTLHHALSNESEFIIVDDLQAIRFCIKQGLPFINSLLLPRVLLLSGVLSQHLSAEYFFTLEELGHYSETVIQKAAMLGPDDLRQFFPWEAVRERLFRPSLR